MLPPIVDQPEFRTHRNMLFEKNRVRVRIFFVVLLRAAGKRALKRLVKSWKPKSRKKTLKK